MPAHERVLTEGDALHGLGFITIVICWLLFGGVAIWVRFDHDVGFVEFVKGGKPELHWWLFAILSCSTVAHADEDDEPVHRYGLVIAGVDLASLALFAATRRAETGAAAAFGGPIVHYAYGNHRGSLWSLGARTVLPITGGLAAVVVGGCASDFGDCEPTTIVGGVLTGLGAAMVLDWIVFAKRPRDSGTSVVPVVRAREATFELGLAGSF